MDATALEGALKWKWPTSTCAHYFDAANVLHVYNWTGGSQPSNSEIEQAIVDYKKTNDYNVPRFDIVMFQTDLADLLPSLSEPSLRWEFAALNTYATNKDFTGLVGYVSMLVSAGAATQADADAVIALLTKQGIVI